jgi:tetratricopeptide (TPR) repeat protein
MLDYDGAISDFNYTLILDPKSGEAYYYRGNVYSKLNKPEAEKDWAEARKLGLKFN